MCSQNSFLTICSHDTEISEQILSVNTISEHIVCEPLFSGAEIVCVHKIDLLLGSASDWDRGGTESEVEQLRTLS